LLNKVSEAIDAGTTKFNNMTYEQGIEAAIRWMTGDEDENPYD
jgi:hypothetical protein